jgi:Icc-related predicted phosphoesterase
MARWTGRRRRLRIAAVGDLHVGDGEKHPFRELFTEIAQNADVLVLAGDLTNLGAVKEAEILAEDISACAIPTIGVLGNHDYECGCVEKVSEILRQAGLNLLEGQAIEIDGVSFVGAKGFAGGFGRYLLSSFGEAATKAFVAEGVQEALRLENAMRSAKSHRVLVVLHYAPIVETVQGEPAEIFPFLGSSRLGETIDRFPVNAIVHGHAHHGTFEGRTPAAFRSSTSPNRSRNRAADPITSWRSDVQR